MPSLSSSLSTESLRPSESESASPQKKADARGWVARRKQQMTKRHFILLGKAYQKFGPAVS